jgi:opacity protein-like surface antigen
MNKLALSTITALLFTSSMAGAADVAVRYVPPAPAPCCEGWEGFYFGGYFGSGQGRTRSTVTDRSTSTAISTTTQVVPDLGTIISTATTPGTDVGAASLTGNSTGSVVNLFAGYNWQPGAYWVIGGQLEGTVFSDITSKGIGTRGATNTSVTTTTAITPGLPTTTTTSTLSGTTNGTIQLNDELRSMFSFLGRAGFLATPNVLIYALGGGTLGNFVVPDSNETFGGKRSKWVLGYSVGAGGEVKLNKNWSLRAEYRYLAFKVDRDLSFSNTATSTFTDPATALVATTTNGSTFNQSSSNKFDLHLGTIGVAYRFCYCE